jgi:putative phage-type endonuclease
METRSDEWREQRLRSVGSSDAPVICRVDPWKTPLELYYIKRGDLVQPDISHLNAVGWGIRLEDLVAKAFAEKFGLKVRRDNKIRFHPDNYWQTCHLDRIINKVGNRPGQGILEVKTTRLSDGWGPSGTDQVPDHVLVQVQHQYAVTGFKWGYVAVLIAGQDERWYEIPPDQGLVDKITALEEQFWHGVIIGEPPAPDFNHPSTEELMKKLYPGTSGESITLPEEALLVHDAYKKAAEQEKIFKEQAKIFKTQLQSLIGDAAVAYLPDGSGWTRKLVQRKGYKVEPCEYIDFRHVKSPKG